jgi:hypothetical protein
MTWYTFSGVLCHLYLNNTSNDVFGLPSICPKQQAHYSRFTTQQVPLSPRFHVPLCFVLNCLQQESASHPTYQPKAQQQQTIIALAG